MSGVPNPRRTRRPWGLVGMLALVVGVERFVARHDLDLSSVTAQNWRYARREATREATRARVLCLGTSMLKFGVVSRVVESGTGRAAFNLSVCSSNVPASYFVLRRAIEAGARPEALLIDGAEAAPLKPEHHAHCRRFWPELLDLRDAVDLAWSTRDPDFLAGLALSRLLPSYKARFEVRNAVTAALRGSSGSSAWECLRAGRNWVVNRGTQVLPGVSMFPDRPPASRPPDVQAATPPDPLRGTYARRLLDLAAEHGIRVFYLLPPVHPSRLERTVGEGSDAWLTGFAREAQAYAPGLVVIDGRYSGYTPDAFRDELHLNARGALAFSAGVTEVVRRHLDGPPPHRLWVELDRYRDPGVDPRLEDLDQSGLALAARATRPAR